MMGAMADRIEVAQRRNRRRRRVARIIYLIVVIAGAIALWALIPKEVVDTVRDTYLNPDAAADLNEP